MLIGLINNCSLNDFNRLPYAMEELYFKFIIIAITNHTINNLTSDISKILKHFFSFRLDYIFIRLFDYKSLSIGIKYSK